MILAGRQGQPALVSKGLTLHFFEFVLGEIVRDFSVLLEDEFVFRGENLRRYFDGNVVFFVGFGHREIADVVEAQHVIQSRNSLPIAQRHGQNVQRFSRHDHAMGDAFFHGTTQVQRFNRERMIRQILNGAQHQIGLQS